MASDDEFMSEVSDFSGDDQPFDPDEDMEQDYEDTLSETGSLSDGGFSPMDKGKGRAMDDDEDSAAHKIDYKVFSIDQLLQEQMKSIDYVTDMLHLKPESAAVLLRHFAWKKDKLIEAYMEDSETTLTKAGIHETGTQPRIKRMRGFTCQVCYNDDDDQETLALSCDHRYCRECYSHYLQSKIVDEGESRRIQCMNSKCAVIVDEKTVELLVSTDALAKYRKLLNRTYVDDNSHLRWCPAPNCENAIECSVAPRQLDLVIPTVHCDCGHTFCFGCGQNDHRPCCCPIVKRWLKKCADDSETSNWISANTKECTKCHSTIEKNGGCNHMTCRKCKWEFCWVCLGPWSEHGTAWYNCARYEEKGGIDIAADAQSKSRASLERYLHYYNRYSNHQLSIQNEVTLQTRADQQISALLEVSSLSWIEAQFINNAVATLGRARNVLKWTYAMAYYLQRNSQTEILENLQNDLERVVETLAELIEKPLPENDLASFRQDVLDKSNYVQKRTDVILNDTLAGYDEERWQWAEPIKL
ncbi:hypothetical protein OIO90_002058 [Microbotryomycetes sp. JL221]|nr:hypothetical protein OIO90_002058 [Microbotryomycetes sp. JL221]